MVYSDKQKSSGGGIVVQEEAAKEENMDDIDIEAIWHLCYPLLYYLHVYL